MIQALPPSSPEAAIVVTARATPRTLRIGLRFNREPAASAAR
jgi:hypothetical protein